MVFYEERSKSKMQQVLFCVGFILIVFNSVNASKCTVGLLDDTNDVPRILAFLSETQKYHFKHSIKKISTNQAYDTLTTTCELLQDGAIAIFGPQFEDNYQVAHSVCYTKDIPHIETRWNDHPQKLTFTVNLYPHAPTFRRILADLVQSQHWDTFTVFFDDYESLSRVTGILEQIRESAISIKQLDVNNTGNYRPILREAWKLKHKNFVIDCHISRLSDVLKQAQQVGLMTSEHAYIITNPDLQTIDLEPYKYCSTNITGIRMIDPDSEAAIKLVDSINNMQSKMDLYPDEIQYLMSNEIRLETALLVDGLHLLKMSLSNLPNYRRCSQSALCNNNMSWHHGATVLSSLKTNSFEGVTGLVQVDSMGNRREFKLEVVELREQGLIKTGDWNPGSALTFLRSANDDIENLRNNTFRVITTLTAPYGMLKESSESRSGNDRFEGFAIDLIHELSLVERFNYTFIIREDNSNGDINRETGQWSGMIGDLINGEADLAISDLTITMERKEAVDFTTPFMNLGISILYRKPSKAPPNFFSFAAPFAIEVWIWIGVAYFIVSISLFIMGRLCSSEWTNPYPCVETPEYLINQFSLRNSFWFMLGSVLQQGSEIAPIAYATRMTAGAWWFFALIIVATYTANLAAHLTTETPDIPFNDVYDLLAKAPKMGIKYGAKAKGATWAFFRGAKSDEFKHIYAYMTEHEDEVMVKENSDGVRRAEEQRYAFFMESVSIEYEIQRHCNLSQVGDELDDKGYGIAMRKNSTYRHRLNTAVLRLQENGKLAELKRRWWEERRGGGQCRGETKSDEAPPLTLKHVGGVFWVTVCGTVLALVLVLVEMVMHVVKQSIKHKKPLRTELKEELKFYLKFRGLVKPVRRRDTSGKSSIESKRSEHPEQIEGEHQEESTYGYLPDITNPNT